MSPPHAEENAAHLAVVDVALLESPRDVEHGNDVAGDGEREDELIARDEDYEGRGRFGLVLGVRLELGE